MQPKTVARNEVKSGYMERNVKLETHLTEPQGTIKKLLQAIVFGSLGMGVLSYTESLIIKKHFGFRVELYAVLLRISSFLYKVSRLKFTLCHTCSRTGRVRPRIPVPLRSD